MVYKILSTLFLTLPCLQPCLAEPKDPTKPAFYSSTKAVSSHEQSSDLKLSSIWSSAYSKRVTINGVTAKQGETIFSDIKIVKIFKNSVLIEQNGIRRKLTLLPRPYKTR